MLKLNGTHYTLTAIIYHRVHFRFPLQSTTGSFTSELGRKIDRQLQTAIACSSPSDQRGPVKSLRMRSFRYNRCRMQKMSSLLLNYNASIECGFYRVVVVVVASQVKLDEWVAFVIIF